MYIVRDKKTQTIIHINPAPLSQELEAEDIYAEFDKKTMEILKTDAPEVPEHFKVNRNGMIVELSLKEKADAGLIQIGAREKIFDNDIIPKQISELVEDGVVELPHDQKIVRQGDIEEVVEKSVSEMVEEGLLILSPSQKIVGSGQDERIVEKTLSEQIEEGILTLQPNQKLVGKGKNERIVTKSKDEMLEEGSITLDEVEEESIQRLRAETEQFFLNNKTENGYRLDSLAREKANFSFLFRFLPDADNIKQEFLDRKLIYPDEIVDEILGEVETVQRAYDEAKANIRQAKKDSKKPNVFDEVSLSRHLPDKKQRGRSDDKKNKNDKDNNNDRDDNVDVKRRNRK